VNNEQKKWADETNNLVSEYVRSGYKTGNTCTIDLAIAHELGLTPSETAQAIMGFSPKVLTLVVNEMKARGTYESVTGSDQPEPS